MAEFELDDDPQRIDLDVVWSFMSTKAYWARWRQRSDVEQQLRTSWRLIGAYRADTGAMVGFARAFSDGVSMAYLADVFVLEEARGHGLGKAIVRAMIDDGPGAEFRWMLHTDDAHGLYQQFGFREPEANYLERPPSRAAVSAADQ